MTEEKTKEIVIERKTSFQGKRCVGLDSGPIISLINNEEAFQEYANILTASLFNYTHEECVGGKEIKVEDSEVFKTLTIKYNLNPERAKTKIKNFLEQYKIKVIPKLRINRDTVLQLLREANKKGIDVHSPDIWIVADFKAYGVNLVYSNNKHFRELCKLINISAPYFPTDEKQTVDKSYFELFRKRKFRK